MQSTPVHLYSTIYTFVYQPLQVKLLRVNSVKRALQSK